MEDFFDQEKAKAIVYLLSEGDNKNKVMISDDQLLVIQKNQKHIFLLANIKVLQTEDKKLLFPLILGGIITPFAFLSYFVNLFNPWLHLFLIMGGLLLLYIGWTGKPSFTIVLKNGDERNYYLPLISNNLLAFIDFANTIQANISGAGLGNLLFFEVENHAANNLFDENSVLKNSPFFPIYGFTIRQLQNEGKSIYADNIYSIDPLKSGREIKFEFDLNTNQMRPKLEGPVLRESLVKQSEFL